MICMIVDDEYNVRRSFVMMGRWRDFGISEVIEATNGLDALALARDRRPEIIITDMRMHALDGAGFLRSLREIPYTPEVVVISGFSDFEYMHSAVENQAVDYVLKPVSEESFNACIRRAVEKYHRRAGSYADMLDAVIQQMNERLVLHGVHENELMHFKIVRDFVQANPRVRIVIPLLLNFEEICRARYRNLTDLLCMQMQQVLDSALQAECANVLTLRIRSDADWDFICLLGSGTDDILPDAALDACLRGIVERLSRLGLRALIGRDREACAKDGLVSSHKLLRQTLMHVALPHVGAQPIVAGVGDPPAARRYFAAHEMAMTQHILHGDAESAGQLIDQVFAQVCVDSRYHVNQLQTLALEFFEIVSHMMVQYDVYPEHSLQLNHIWSAVYGSLDNMEHQKALFKRYFEQVCGMFAPGAGGPQHIVSSALQFIEAHHGEKLTLSMLAQNLYVSREHLSRLLRQETGKTFTDHLSEMRLVHVCRLLATTDLPLASIAERTGFIDPNYLSRVFRRAYGITPMKHRAGAQKKRAGDKMLSDS
ncbi:helix-turn-helix domain-containing protein [Eubacteriales bacterium OttesenSCG-928-A19]|nr:helix-turn-helix domain-containing protein [Eubacteriales bacterium OttesenSCG-928-A19]